MTHPEAEAVTDDHKKLVFSFIRTLKATKLSDGDAVDAVVRGLSTLFDIDPAAGGSAHDTPVNVLTIFRSALHEHDRRVDAEHDEKFTAFVELLERKGYFGGVEKDSAEYKERLQRAREKFNKRNNPYDGMTASQIKNKGNEFMTQGKYKEAVTCYTKAIELEPENSVFFANRAAAHTHLRDYNSAVNDCERAIVLDPNYSKSYSRMGTALFYQENYARAEEAFSKACELEPANETYQNDLKRTQEKLAERSTSSRAPGMPGMPGMPGGFPDMSQLANMMNNPQFMQMAQNMMQNPQFSGMVANMTSMLGGNGNFTDPEAMLAAARNPQPDEQGNLRTPFGTVPASALSELQQEMMANPRLAAVSADVQANGISAMQKYLGDPEVDAVMAKFTQLMMQSTQNDNNRTN